MLNRKEFRIPYLDFQKILNDFTLANREFTAYSADKLEWVLWYHSKSLMRANVRYARFDTSTNELVFLYPWDYIEPQGGLLTMPENKLLDKPSTTD